MKLNSATFEQIAAVKGPDHAVRVYGIYCIVRELGFGGYRQLVSHATYYRHIKVLRDFGLVVTLGEVREVAC